MVKPNEYKHLMFIDINAELSDTDKKALERLGFVVIKINGNPDHAVRLEYNSVEEN